MKKVKLTFGVLLMSVAILASCGNKADSIKVEELNDACSIVNAMGQVADKMIDFKNKYKDATEKPSDDVIAQAKSLENKMKELKARGEKLELKAEDLEACEGSKEIMSKIKELNLRF